MSLTNLGYKIVFAGTPEHAASVLAALAQSKHQLIAVYTQPDKPAGRGRKLMPSPVKIQAENLGLPVLQPVTLKTVAAQQRLAELKPDLMIVFAYGLILPPEILTIPTYGCLNIHTSILPRWRGAAPVQRAIMAGDNETGVSIMAMDAGLDTGAVVASSQYIIQNSDNTGTVLDNLTAQAIPLLLNTLDNLETALDHKQAQDNTLACYAAKITKEDAHINWDQPAAVIERNIRGLYPAPIAYSTLGELNIKIHQAELIPGIAEHKPGTIFAVSKQGICVQTATDAVCITQAQLPGAKVLAAKDLLNRNNHPFIIGAQFT